MIAPLGATCQVTVEHHVFATRQSSNKAGYFFLLLVLVSLSLSFSPCPTTFSQCRLGSLASCKRASRQATSTHAIKRRTERLHESARSFARTCVCTRTLVRACVRDVLRVRACTYHAGYIVAGCVFPPPSFGCDIVSSCALTLCTSRTS